MDSQRLGGAETQTHQQTDNSAEQTNAEVQDVLTRARWDLNPKPLDGALLSSEASIRSSPQHAGRSAALRVKGHAQGPTVAAHPYLPTLPRRPSRPPLPVERHPEGGGSKVAGRRSAPRPGRRRARNAGVCVQVGGKTTVKNRGDGVKTHKRHAIRSSNKTEPARRQDGRQQTHKASRRRLFSVFQTRSRRGRRFLKPASGAVLQRFHKAPPDDGRQTLRCFTTTVLPGVDRFVFADDSGEKRGWILRRAPAPARRRGPVLHRVRWESFRYFIVGRLKASRLLYF